MFTHVLSIGWPSFLPLMLWSQDIVALRKENEQNVHNATWFRVWIDQFLRHRRKTLSGEY